MKRNTITAALLLTAALLSSCGKDADISVSDIAAEVYTEAPTEEMTSAPATESPVRETKPQEDDEEQEEQTEIIPETEPPTEKETDFTGDYVHGTEGYFCLADTGLDIGMKLQKSGTCWAFASSAAIENSFFMNTGRKLEIDPLTVVDRVYGSDKTEGVFVKDGQIAENIGGSFELVVDRYSSGVDGIFINEAVMIDQEDREAVKEAIRKYGGAVAAIDETATKRQYTHGYLTFNNPKPSEPDHELLIIGWDDNFPKSYFKKKAEQNGAWIAYNSNIGEFCYYYISYDTAFDELAVISATDKYSSAVSYDTGNFYGRTKKTGKISQVANVFRQPGQLAAVGTFCNNDTEHIKIEVYDASFSELLCAQEAEMNGYGWHIIDLDQPLNVTECAVAVSYDRKIPFESSWEANRSECRSVIEPGQSFANIDGKWTDLTDKDIKRLLDVKFNPGNCCIKAYYK